MVKVINVSQYSGSQTISGLAEKITGGPLYELALIQRVAGQDDRVQFWTRGCIKDAASLQLDTLDVAALLQELKRQDYRDSEWCSNGKGTWAACDAYVLRRSEWMAAAHKTMWIDYFLKFALSKTGALLLMVSCHTSN